MRTPASACLAALGCCLAAIAAAQGQDSTPAERNLRIMAELLPGIYDNANQHYFDKRRDLPAADRHARINTTIARVEAPAFGPHVFLWVNRVQTDAGEQASYRIATLSADQDGEAVVMRHYLRMDGPIGDGELADLTPSELRRTEGCDYFFRRRADHFRGSQREHACRFDWDGRPVYTDNTIEISASSLWFHDHKYVADGGERITGVASGEPFWLERARVFHCYVDMPGVGGGRAIPFERYDGIALHDKGGLHWFTTREAQPRKVGILLQSVTWHVLNERGGNFNRDSLVLYAMEELPDGDVKEHGYAFTEPTAERIGQNLKWMLVNCSMIPRDSARPEL